MRFRFLTATRHLLGVLWLVLTVALLALSGLTHLAGNFDRQVFIVRGASMEPTLPLGSIIIIRPPAVDDLRIGDIVTVRGERDGYLTHRIVDLRPDLGGQMIIRTRGDANVAGDAGLVPLSNVIGEVESYVPLLGYVIAFLAMPTGLVASLAAMGALLLARWALDDALRRTRRHEQARLAPDGAASARA